MPRFEPLIVSKFLITRFYSDASKVVKQSSSAKDYQLDPNGVTGFVDGEGSFTCSIVEDKKFQQGWRVKHSFLISLHVKDKEILRRIQITLGVGKIYTERSESLQLRVESIKKFKIIIKFFKKYYLLTKKRGDFLLLCEIIAIFDRGDHLTPSGLRKIVAIKAAMNWGLSDKLQLAFPDVVAVARPHVELPKTIHPEWLAGFTSAEGSFIINVYKSKTRVGYAVGLVFVLTQHQRDVQLLVFISKYLNCGHVSKSRDVNLYRVTKFDDIDKKIIPFFKKYPIRGVKEQDFADWSDVAVMMKQKQHLTEEGLERISKKKAGMNIRRKLD